MKKLIAALLLLPLLPLTQSAATAQNAAPGGNAAAGKMYWDSNLTACKNCHGGMGEGAFGPDLAGRGLNGAQVYRAAHQPWGIMPAFIERQLSQQQANDVAAYFSSMPKPAQPGKWRFEAAASDPPGKQALMNVGCGQCHTPLFQGPRGNLGAVNADFNYFANLVYNHTTAIHTHRVSLGGNANGNVDMGDYNKSRVTESTLREIYDWAKNDIGFRAPMQGRLSAAAPAANGATYTLTVLNNGMKGKGVTAQGLTIHLLIPAGTTVVATTGAGYKGVHMDAEDKGMVAEWTLTRSGPKDEATYTITLSKPATKEDNLRGTIRWAKPAPKTGPSADVVNIAPAPTA
jgi:mono/diheme cytochrome c family protein